MASRRPVLRAVALWLAAALGLGLLSLGLERRTAFELYFDGGEAHWQVAGSRISAPVDLRRVASIGLHLVDSVEPPGGGFLELFRDGDRVFRDDLPRRFHFPAGWITPVGDWEVDEQASAANVFFRELELLGAFTVRGELRGRFLHAATLTVNGDHSFHLQFRRGLINNDLFILDESGETTAAGSIDPTPAADLGSVLATLLRAAALASLLLAARAATSNWGPQLAAPTIPERLQWSLVTVLALASAALSLWTATAVLERLPHQPDGVAYLVQAGWLNEGQLSWPIPPLDEHYDPPYIYHRGGRLLSHYPVGWPLLLAAGRALGAPWLVNPLLRLLFTVLVFLLGREAASPAAGLLASLFAALSPLTTLLFASYLAHGAAATALSAFLWLLLRATRRGSSCDAVAAGLAVGAAFCIRPVSAVALAAAGALFLAHHSRLHRDFDWARWRLPLGVAAGGLAASLPAFIHNILVTGHPLHFPYTLARGTMYAAAKLPFGLRNLDAILATLSPELFGWGWPFLSGRLALALPLALVMLAYVQRRLRPASLLLGGSWLALALIYLGAKASGLHGFGPRYHFEAGAALLVLAACGVLRLAGAARAPAFRAALVAAAAAGLLLISALFLPQRLGLYRGYNQVDGRLADELDATALEYAMVLFTDPAWQNWGAVAPFLDPDPDGRLLFASAGDDPYQLLLQYGDRTILVWDGEQLACWDPAQAALMP